MITSAQQLKTKIFADGADLYSMVKMNGDPLIAGFTTNPTLMKKAGVEDYERFARAVLEEVREKPISFEVFSDEFPEMREQARKIALWGTNVYVKIPITNTRGASSANLIGELAAEGIKLNVTAVFTLEQIEAVLPALVAGTPSYVSVFAGRIADSGRDPVALMSEAVDLLRPHSHVELIWASPREVLNVVQADEVGCDIITVTWDILKKLNLLGKDLNEFSLDTVKMFYADACAAGFVIG